MTTLLQINLHCSKAAQDHLHQAGIEKAADYKLITEPDHIETSNWYSVYSNKAAIINAKHSSIDQIGAKEQGFCWIQSGGVRLYSCYWSPNSTLLEYKDFIARLELSIRSANFQVLVTDDFNAHHTDWGSRSNSKRGEALSDSISALGLMISNSGNTPTFCNRNGLSIIDLTIASPALANKIVKWEVLDTISLSDHRYIRFKIQNQTSAIPKDPPQWNSRKVNIKKLEAILRDAKPDLDLTGCEAEECARLLTSSIQNTCKGVVPPTGGSHRKSVYWWSPEIGSLRKTANHLRRVFQRKKKGLGPHSCIEEETKAKETKRMLVKAIKAAKDEKWCRLCDQVEHDPWGCPTNW